MTIETNLEFDWRDLLDRLGILLGMNDSDRLRDARLDTTVQPQRLAVLEHLPHALALGDGDTAPICRRVERLKSVLSWRQNSNYTGAEFLDGYAYCELVGPIGFPQRHDLALGLLLLGPHVTYPEHVHPAAETYAVVAGRAHWWQADKTWRSRAPGERIHHISMESHAMRTAEEPLLAAYLWRDHLDDGARLV